MYKKAKRFDGQIKPLKSNTIPRRMLFFDTETTPDTRPSRKGEQVFDVACSTYIVREKNGIIKNRESIVTNTIEETIEFIVSKASRRNKLYVFAHNIGFDLAVLLFFDYCNNREIEMRPPIQEGMRFIWNVKLPEGSISFINTGNYVPRTLASIGKDLGFPKLDADFDNMTRDELITYCQRDVDIIEQFILQFLTFLQDNNLGAFKTTLASQALTAFRTRFMNTPINLHSHPIVTTAERNAYSGGRTEPFFIGDVPEPVIYGLDINSMYPYCMIQGNIPVEFISAIKEQKLTDILDIMEYNYVIAEVILNTSEPFHGVKWNDKRYTITNSDKNPVGNKLIFPIGRFKTTLHHDELLYAINNGHIEEVLTLYLYKPDNPFADYVEFFTQMKTIATETGNKTNRMMSKLFLNSLYGKFGQLFHHMIKLDNDVDFTIHPMNGINIDTGFRFTDFTWFNDLYRTYTNGEATYSFPAIAGTITARARMLLWSYITTVGRENVYYCDTDSIYTNTIGYERLKAHIHPTRLGALDVEAELSSMKIYGAKNYRKNDVRVTKGVAKSATWHDEHTATMIRFEGFKELRNDGFGRPPRVWEQTKVSNSPYDKAIVSTTGHTRPYEILEDC